MNPEKMRDSLKEMVREVVREEMGGQGNFLYGTYVSSGTSPGRHNISILDKSFSNIPALASVGAMQPGDTVVCIRSRAMPLTIIGRFGVGGIPGELIASSQVTADSATFTTTETTVLSVTAPLVSGRTYRVAFYGKFATTVAGDIGVARMREDSSTGPERQSDFLDFNKASTTIGYSCYMEFEYTASSTGNKTFVVTGVRNVGSGTLRLEAASNRPSYLRVEYVSG